MTMTKIRITEIACDACGCIAQYEKPPGPGQHLKPIGWTRVTFAQKIANDPPQRGRPNRSFQTRSFDLCPDCDKKLRAQVIKDSGRPSEGG